MKYLLDASAVIDYLKNQSQIAEILDHLEEGSKVILPVIAKAEVKYVNQDIGVFEKLETVSLEDQDLQEAIKILNFLERKGEKINMVDILIAANSIKENGKLITTDKDFEKLEDYEGFNYKTVTRN